jgi:D-inositol-3-phosphate glycosyltransferase
MSRHALDLLQSEYGRTGTLTPGGVRVDQFVPATAREPQPTILFSAALDEPRKGGANLVRALDIVMRTEPDVRLWLSGPGDPGQILAEASERTRQRIDVLPLGDPETQAERYGRAWVTALPSWSDSFGLVVIESLACGTPVAASDHAALPELVTPGETGALCDPEDVESVASALCAAIEIARRSTTVDACRSSAATWDWDTVIAPGYEGIYAGEDVFRREVP